MFPAYRRACALVLALVVVALPGSHAATLPAGFQESVVFSGLTQPTAVRFVSDGRVFVAEKSGLIKVFSSLTDPTPDTFADLRTKVHNFWDRGLLGLALHPNFPTTPYVYVLYTLDAAIGGTPPRWGTAGTTSDGCANPPGATGSGCLVAARVSRLEAAGNFMTGAELVLAEDWCQQFPSHSIGSLGFGADGALYVSGGDGASFTNVDYGQFGGTGGVPKNPCADPPVPAGGNQTLPSAEGGALRSQDLLTSSDPVSFDGTILRINPLTGAALPDNPLYGGSRSDDDRIIAFGLRNPFRMTLRPGTNEVWLGDVGWNTWEEINRIPTPTAGVVNFGWPCYESLAKQPEYSNQNPKLTMCENLYAQGAGAVRSPFYTYNHADKVVTGESCATGSSSISGVAFYSGGPYPAAYDGALFFSDYSRKCIWAMLAGGGPDPNPSNRLTFVAGAAGPVELQIGPNGDLFYVDFDTSTIRRIRFFSNNQPPTAVASADRTNGPAPLTVNFNASGSSDPDPGDTLTYAWDLDGDGAYDDSTAVAPTRTYTTPGTYTVGLRVTDVEGATDVDSLTISADNTPPTATIATPTATKTWKVGEVINFDGSATDPQQGPLPASAFTWSLIIHHCPSNCHTHPGEDFAGVTSGTFPAPDHDYPSHLELRLTVQDAGGLTDTKSVLLQPDTVVLRFETTPSGLQLVVGTTTQAAPFERTVIVGSAVGVSAPSPQTQGPIEYDFSSWSDGGAASHIITAPPTELVTYRATFVAACMRNPTQACDDGNPCTTDTCDPVGDCLHANNSAPCNDGNACTANDVCQGGACGGTTINCNEGNPCTDDSCNPATGCVHTPNSAPCNDGNECTLSDVCSGTVCAGQVDPGCTTCQSAVVVPAAGGTFTGATSGASTQGGSCGSSQNSPERVYQWTPAVSGVATIQTCSSTGTTYDTVLYLRQDTCVGGVQLNCNDDTPGCGTTTNSNFGSRLTPTVTAGRTYFIFVDGYNGRSGSFSLGVVPPGAPPPTTTTTTIPGDACNTPTVIPAAGGVVTGTTSGPSTQGGSCGASQNSPERVYTWTPAASGIATIETCSATATSYDTVLHVRGGTCTGPEVGCNDDTSGCGTTSSAHHGSRLSPNVVAGETYVIIVDGYNGRSGSFSLRVVPPGAPPPTTTTRRLRRGNERGEHADGGLRRLARRPGTGLPVDAGDLGDGDDRDVRHPHQLRQRALGARDHVWERDPARVQPCS